MGSGDLRDSWVIPDGPPTKILLFLPLYPMLWSEIADLQAHICLGCLPCKSLRTTVVNECYMTISYMLKFNNRMQIPTI